MVSCGAGRPWRMSIRASDLGNVVYYVNVVVYCLMCFRSLSLQLSLAKNSPDRIILIVFVVSLESFLIYRNTSGNHRRLILL